jgi:MinD-like ATPase involved in chromosome partitioning or flagellar assembly
MAGPAESAMVAAIEATASFAVVRRCADLAELLATAAAGLGEVALVSADLRALDRAALAELAAQGMHVAGAVDRDDESGERRLRQLGLAVIVTAELAPHELDDALDALCAADRAPGAHSELGPHSELGRDSGFGSPGLPDDPAAESADLPAPGVRGRVIAVWGPTGAPGRSTVALNLAAELAGRSATLLVDADTYGASLAQALGLLDEAPGLAAAARAAEQGTLDLVALARLAPAVSEGLRVLTGIPRAERWTELRAASMTHVLDLARDLAPFVVVDCGFAIEDDEELSYDTLAPRRNAATLTTLEAADDLVVVGSADPVGLQRLVRAVQDLRTLTVPPPRVVVNRVRSTSVGSHPQRRISEALGRFAGLEDLTFLPWDQTTIDGALFAGLPLSEFAPQSELRRALADLAAGYAGVEPSATRHARRARRTRPRALRS